MFGFAAPCQYAEEALSGFRHFFLCEFGNSLIISISVFNPGTPMTKQEYVVFWHADSAEYADCLFLYLRNLRDLRAKTLYIVGSTDIFLGSDMLFHFVLS